jgi:phosphoribosylamine---glycine ligase
LYAGLMIAPDGSAKVLEYNCRFGDPETQPIMMRLKSDLVELCLAATRGELDKVTAEFDERPAVGVVMAAGGYPDAYRKGDVIAGLGLGDNQGKVFHAGTATQGGHVVTQGGRVLCATALGNTVTAAQKAAYALVETVHWDEVYFRTDIAYRAIAREQQA